MFFRSIKLTFFCMFFSLNSFAASDCSDILDTANAQSTWVSVNSSGQLVYRLTSRGDRVMDFSYAGYGGGGVAIPNVPTVIRVSPTGQDDTSNIQAAIDKVSAMPLSKGFRGAVLLTPGIYSTTQALVIKASGLVLRGSGSSDNGTVINLVAYPHVFLQIAGQAKPDLMGKAVQITDPYVPSGAMQIHVTNAQNFRVGDAIVLRRPVTEAWVEFMGMSNLCPNCDWLSPGKFAQYDRVITAVDPAQKLITLDAPIPDSLDSPFLQPQGATLMPHSMLGRIQQVGVEHLHINAPLPEMLPVRFPKGPTFGVLKISGAQNAWAQDITGENFVAAIIVADYSKWITLQDIAFINNPPAKANGPKQFQFSFGNVQMLLCNRCISGGDNTFSFATGSLTPGPNVILNSTGNDLSRLEPHMRWATGLLVDNFNSAAGGIDFMSRGSFGTGHGWTMGWGVIWNSSANTFELQQPPGAMTWVIGAQGSVIEPPFPAGGSGDRHGSNQYPATIESFGTPVSPKSLYLAQLCVRKGRAAVANLGY